MRLVKKQNMLGKAKTMLKPFFILNKQQINVANYKSLSHSCSRRWTEFQDLTPEFWSHFKRNVSDRHCGDPASFRGLFSDAKLDQIKRNCPRSSNGSSLFSRQSSLCGDSISSAQTAKVTTLLPLPISPVLADTNKTKTRAKRGEKFASVTWQAKTKWCPTEPKSPKCETIARSAIKEAMAALGEGNP